MGLGSLGGCKLKIKDKGVVLTHLKTGKIVILGNIAFETAMVKELLRNAGKWEKHFS